MKAFTVGLAIAIGLIGQQLLACTLSPKGYSEVQIKLALQSVPDYGAVRLVEINGDHVLIEYVEDGRCKANGFKLFDMTGMCKFILRPDGAIKNCKSEK